MEAAGLMLLEARPVTTLQIPAVTGTFHLGSSSDREPGMEGPNRTVPPCIHVPPRPTACGICSHTGRCYRCFTHSWALPSTHRAEEPSPNPADPRPPLDLQTAPSSPQPSPWRRFHGSAQTQNHRHPRKQGKPWIPWRCRKQTLDHTHTRKAPGFSRPLLGPGGGSGL